MLKPSEFPELLNYKGQDLIVTDGTTLLGADDKAGIAEIISAVVLEGTVGQVDSDINVIEKPAQVWDLEVENPEKVRW